MAVVLFASPASDDEIGGERDEQRQEEDAALWEAQIDGGLTLQAGARVDGGKKEREQSDYQKRNACCDYDVCVLQPCTRVVGSRLFACGRMDGEGMLSGSLRAFGKHTAVVEHSWWMWRCSPSSGW